MATQTLENPVIQVSGTATVEPSVEVANLCEIKDGRVGTTSLRVAEVFDRKHKTVLQAIRELDCSPDFHGQNFLPMLKTTQLGNSATRQDPYFFITRDGFVFLVMGFTGKTAAKFKEAYIRAFNVMEERLRRMQQPAYTMADAPRLVHEQLERMEAGEQPIVEFYGQQRVVSSVTLARLQGRKHEYVCDSIRAAMRWAIRPARQFYRTTRTVRKGFGKGYDFDGGIIYYVTIEGFQTMRQHCPTVTDELYRRVIADFNRNKGKAATATRKLPPTPPDDAPAGAQQQGPGMPKDAADMMSRFVKAMALMMGVDVNEVSDLISGGRK